MSRLDGGIFSRPRGKTANIVFGAARTREGKVVTARELVPPSNPQTPPQQNQRSKFQQALYIARQIGKSIYGSDLNRAVSQLPGFQGLMSILMNNMDDNFLLSAPSTLNLGNLFFPSSYQVSSGINSGELEYQPDGSLGPNGTATDQIVTVTIESAAGGSPSDRQVVINTNQERQDSQVTITGLTPGADYTCMLYYRGAGTAQGLLSQAVWRVASALA